METIHMKYPHVKTLRRLYTLLCQMVHFGHNAHLMLALREGGREGSMDNWTSSQIVEMSQLSRETSDVISDTKLHHWKCFEH